MQDRAMCGADALIDELEDEPRTLRRYAEYVRLRLVVFSQALQQIWRGVMAAAERVRSQGRTV